MASLLVTGGAGFIGVNFVRYWLDRHGDDRIVVLDALTYAGNRRSLSDVDTNPNFLFVHGDICDQKLVQQLLVDERLDTIVHFAAESHVDRSIVGPERFVSTNILGTYRLLEAAKAVWLDQDTGIPTHRFHHVSTDEVYGSLKSNQDPCTEETQYAPNSPYAASKASSDHLVRAYFRTYGLQTSISNCSNNFGAFQFPEKLIPLMIINALHGEPLPIYGDGRNVRDWLHVLDHCRAIDLILQTGVPGETYNVGGNAERRNIDVVETVCGLLDEAMNSMQEFRTRFPKAGSEHGSKELIQFTADRPGHDRRYAIDHSKISTTLRYMPETSFEEGIAQTLRWYLDHQYWWEAVLDQSYRDWMQENYVARR